MQNPSTQPPPLSDRSGVTDAVRAQILATEHWSLLATRSIIWNEVFSRASVFLTVLSASMVALALVGQATAFGQGFRLFALVVLPIVLLVGLGTYSRLSAANNQDMWLVVGMNRLRHAYLELAPELEPYFITGHNDDLASVWKTYNPNAASLGIGVILSSTPHLIGALVAIVAGALAAIIAETFGLGSGTDLVIGVGVGLVVLAVLFVGPIRSVSRLSREYRPRFPS
jgi:hypothetical protein